MTDNRQMPPDAVHVWRGLRLSSLELAAFYGRLGTVFVPATVLMQIDDYLVYQELGPIAPGAKQGPSGVPLLFKRRGEP